MEGLQREEFSMRLSRVGLWLLTGLGSIALVTAQTPASSASSQTNADPPAMSGVNMGGYVMGNRMMTFNNQVRDLLTQLQENLSELETENQVATIHNQIANDQKLVEQLENTLNGHCGMSMGTMGSSMNGPMMQGSYRSAMGGYMMGNNNMMGSGMSSSNPSPQQDGNSTSQEQPQK